MSRRAEPEGDPVVRRGTTLVELMVALSLLVVVSLLVGRWFIGQRRNQARMMRRFEIQENARRATWRIGQEMRTGRVILWPRCNPDGSPRSDDMVVFKSFRGELVAYFHDPETETLRRCLIPNGPGDPAVDPLPVAVAIGSATFTTHGLENKLLSMHLCSESIDQIDAVQLLND